MYYIYKGYFEYQGKLWRQKIRKYIKVYIYVYIYNIYIYIYMYIYIYIYIYTFIYFRVFVLQSLPWYLKYPWNLTILAFFWCFLQFFCLMWLDWPDYGFFKKLEPAAWSPVKKKVIFGWISGLNKAKVDQKMLKKYICCQCNSAIVLELYRTSLLNKK